MKFGEFERGRDFKSAAGTFRCTDIGTRVVVAIRIGDATVGKGADVDGWLNGPPYALEEIVFDEDDFEGLEPA